MKLAKAARAYEDFTGRKPTKVRRVQLDNENVAGWEMGPAVGVAYEAVRDGEKAQYFHEFAKSARPRLVARDDGRQLYFTDGKYTVTERGIEDMPEMFVVNPSTRRGAASKRKPKTMAAKRNSKGRFVKGSGGRRAPAKRRRAATRTIVVKANPAPRKRRRSASAKVSRRSYRRNPSGGRNLSLRGLGKLFMPAAGIGAGAVVTEMAMGYFPFPVAWKSGVMRQVTKAGMGIALGWVLAKFLKQKTLGFYVAAGAVAIGVHDGIKEVMTSRMPALAGKGQFGQYVLPMGSQFAGARARRGIGYVNPAAATRFGQYVRPPASQFAGDAPLWAHPGGETNFAA